MTTDERLAVIRAYVGERANRRHKPGRALERLTYRFDVLADYGAFRDLQRHRMLIDRVAGAQPAPRLHPARGRRPGRRRRALRRGDGALGRRCTTRWPSGSRPRRAYAVSLAYKVRFYLHLNAREAMHLLELRTTPAGPPRLPGGRPGDAPPHRRAGRPPRGGRGDALRRPLTGAEPRAPRRRARRGASSADSAPPRSAWPRPAGASTCACAAPRVAVCELMWKLGVEGLMGRR